MKFLMVILLGSIGIISCKKETIANEPPYIEQWWDEYYGTYTVFDTLNDITYEMKITQIERYYEGISIRDSMVISNITNRFSIRRYFEQGVTYIGGISLGVDNPIFDIEGNRWAFSSGLGKKENSDTLELIYTLSNIAYYMEDGVPYYACECVDLAVKNE